MNFDCPNCNKKSKRLIYVKDTGVFCSHCYVVEPPSYSYLHDKVHNDTIRHECPNMTEAKDRVLQRRIKSPEDGRTIIDRDTRRPTEY